MTGLPDGIPRGAMGAGGLVSIFTFETAYLIASEVSYNYCLLEYDLN
jgi:hypothetical protein